jgi:hypothetical protein
MDSPAETTARLVPDDVIPHQHLPPLRYRDLPDPIPWTRMVGPSVMLAGLALGSGEFVMWPHIVYKSGFVFIWAAFLGILTQYFLNMEIERWTLATGESAITGFCRLSPQWALVMLILNIVPWAWPGWATGAGEILSWLIFGPIEETRDGLVMVHAKYLSGFGIAGLVACGLVLTTGPVVYNTVEKIQVFLVVTIIILAIVIGVTVVRYDAVTAMLEGATRIGTMPDPATTGLGVMTLLGALAFAGAGGTMNLGQSNYIRDKQYGMGRYVGRITSPITGQEEATLEIGYHFPNTPENRRKWRGWWRAANAEHCFSFLLTCFVCLSLMTLIAYSLLYDKHGQLAEGVEQYGSGTGFVWAEAKILSERPFGSILRLLFLFIGVAVLLTTELGVLDVAARVSTDIVKVNYLRENAFWTQSRLYFCFLWAEIAFGIAILLFSDINQPFALFRRAAAMNGAVMFIYSLILLYMNTKILPRSIAITPVRFVCVAWAAAFFGYFTIQALRIDILPSLAAWFSTASAAS